MRRFFILLFTMILSVTTAVAAEPSSSTEGRRMAKRTLIPLGRAVVGPVIGGTVGRLVTGSPTGVIIGSLLSSSPTETAQQEQQARPPGPVGPGRQEPRWGHAVDRPPVAHRMGGPQGLLRQTRVRTLDGVSGEQGTSDRQRARARGAKEGGDHTTKSAEGTSGICGISRAHWEHGNPQDVRLLHREEHSDKEVERCFPRWQSNPSRST
jgi:hypothetical protein